VAAPDFPLVTGRDGYVSSGYGTSHTVPLPDSNAGDLILMVMASLTSEPSSAGFVPLEPWDSAMKIYPLYKIATGNEGSSATINMAGSAELVVFVWVISGTSADGFEGGVRLDSGYGTSVDPPALSPSWGSDKTLWIAYAGGLSDNANGYPTGFTQGRSSVSGGSTPAGVAAAELSLEAASVNPSAFTYPGFKQRSARTLGFEPLAIQDFFGEFALTAEANLDFAGGYTPAEWYGKWWCTDPTPIPLPDNTTWEDETGRQWRTHGDVLWAFDKLILDGGSFVSTEDINLFDADTAHLQQSRGTWDAGAIAPDTSSPGLYGDNVAQMARTGANAVATTAQGTGGAPVKPSTQHSISVWMKADADADFALTLMDFDAGGAQGLGAEVGRTPNVPANTWVEVVGLASTTGDAAFAAVRLRGYLPGTSSNNPDTVNYEWKQVSLREGTDPTFYPSLWIAGTLDETVDPVGMSIGYAGDGTPLTVGESWAGEAVSYIRRDGVAGPVTASLDVADIPAPCSTITGEAFLDFTGFFFEIEEGLFSLDAEADLAFVGTHIPPVFNSFFSLEGEAGLSFSGVAEVFGAFDLTGEASLSMKGSYVPIGGGGLALNGVADLTFTGTHSIPGAEGDFSLTAEATLTVTGTHVVPTFTGKFLLGAVASLSVAGGYLAETNGKFKLSAEANLGVWAQVPLLPGTGSSVTGDRATPTRVWSLEDAPTVIGQDDPTEVRR